MSKVAKQKRVFLKVLGSHGLSITSRATSRSLASSSLEVLLISILWTKLMFDFKTHFRNVSVTSYPFYIYILYTVLQLHVSLSYPLIGAVGVISRSAELSLPVSGVRSVREWCSIPIVSTLSIKMYFSILVLNWHFLRQENVSHLWIHLMVHGSRSKPLWHFGVHRVSLLCCCKRTDQAGQNLCLVQRTAEVQTGVPPQMEYLGLGNGKGRLLRNNQVQLKTTMLE